MADVSSSLDLLITHRSMGICESCIGYNDFQTPDIWIAALGEFLGILFLTFIGCGACLGDSWQKAPAPNIVQIALAFGFIIATMAWCIGSVSGGHMNPAITMAFFVTRKIGLLRALLYIVVQCIGACVGVGILAAVTAYSMWSNLGQTTLSSVLSSPQGLGVEFLGTFVLVFTVFAVSDDARDQHGSRPLTVGIAAICIHLTLIKYTGCGINPARALGPPMILTLFDSGAHVDWSYHWIYWIGPFGGAIFAGLLYDLLFAADASVERARNLFTRWPDRESEYEDDDDDKNQPNRSEEPVHHHRIPVIE